MKVFKGGGRHRLLKNRLPRAVVNALLITFALGIPAGELADRRATYVTSRER